MKDATGQALAYVYARDSKAQADTAKVLTMDEARRIAANIAKLPSLLKGLRGIEMIEKPVHKWTKHELLQMERGYPLGEVFGDQIRAEIIRRAALRNERYLLAGVIVAAVSALGSMIAAVATLIALYQLR